MDSADLLYELKVIMAEKKYEDLSSVSDAFNRIEGLLTKTNNSLVRTAILTAKIELLIDLFFHKQEEQYLFDAMELYIYVANTSGVSKELISNAETILNIIEAFWENSKDINILEQLIIWGNHYLSNVSSEEFLYSFYLTGLANAYLERYKLYQNVDDLEANITLLEEALRIESEPTSGRAELIVFLASSLSIKFLQTRSLSDLNSLIQLYEECKNLSFDDPLMQFVFLNDYSVALKNRFIYYGYYEDIENSISLLNTARKIQTNNVETITTLLNNLLSSLTVKYIGDGNSENLNEALQIGEYLLESASLNTENRFLLELNLSALFGAKYQRSGDADDLKKWLQTSERASSITPINNEYQANILINLSSLFLVMFVKTGEENYLEKALKSATELYNLQKDNPTPDSLFFVSRAIGAKYIQSGSVDHLHKWVELARKSVMIAEKGSINYPALVENLSRALTAHFMINGDATYIIQSIEMCEEMLRTIKDGSSHIPQINLALANALINRFLKSGDISDLDRTIDICKRTKLQVKKGTEEYLGSLALSAMAYANRYSISGIKQDLDLAIQLGEETDWLVEKGSSYIMLNPSYLLLAYLYRFQLTEDRRDLGKCMKLAEDLFSKKNSLAPNSVYGLVNLSAFYLTLFKYNGDLSVLNKGIEISEKAIITLPKVSFLYPLALSNAAMSYCYRYERLDVQSDLTRSIDLMEEAIQHLDPDMPNRQVMLNNYSKVLMYRYNRDSNIKDLNRAFECLDEAINIDPTGANPITWMLHSNLALFLIGKYHEFGGLDDLSLALASLQKARDIAVSPFSLAYVHAITSEVYYSKYLEIGDELLFTSAVTELVTAIEYYPENSYEKIWSYYELGQRYFSIHSYKKALNAFEKMAEYLEKLRASSPSKNDRKKLSTDAADGYAKLVYCCLRLGQPEKAFQFAEEGKSRLLVDLLHNQIADLENIPTKEPELLSIIEQYKAVQQELKRLVGRFDQEVKPFELMDPNRRVSPFSAEEIHLEIQKNRELEEALLGIIEMHIPAFSLTVSAPPFYLKDGNDLSTCENATIISYYIDSAGLLAFVVNNDSLKAIRLLNIGTIKGLYQKAIAAIDRPLGQTLMSYVLEEAWDLLLKPLCDYLPEHGSSLIIAPFGELHLLPFVAFKDRKTGDCLIDRYQVKITTSLNTLKAMRAQADLPAEIQADKAMTVVAYPGAENPNEPAYLKGVDAEAEEIPRLFQKPTVALTKSNATTKKTLENAAGSEKLHFACHGMFNPKDPYRSGLKLKDAWLTVRDITTRMNLSGTDLVVMSSCLSGFSGVSKGEELTGLLTAFIASRARAVVGSLWSVDDKSTAKFMTEFYKNLQNGKPKAEALRDAQLYIRKQPQWSHPYYWAPFFITGVE